ncbi:MAG: hypothetical protein N3B18_11975 [Desulfobacterota bacterium]|nr:hypothetical protein [Thermodesulfobacteriota bacterium]
MTFEVVPDPAMSGIQVHQRKGIRRSPEKVLVGMSGYRRDECRFLPGVVSRSICFNYDRNFANVNH